MTTITEFLLARIADDEVVARSAQRPDQPIWTAVERERGLTGRTWDVAGSSGRFSPSIDAVEHVVRFQPVRMLAECEAKRLIVRAHPARIAGKDASTAGPGAVRCSGCIDRPYPCINLRALASLYSDHEDYETEWATS